MREEEVGGGGADPKLKVRANITFYEFWRCITSQQ